MSNRKELPVMFKVIEEAQKRISWDAFFMGTAIVAANRSPDLRKVGAVLVDNNTHRIISTGYNGLLPGVDEKSINWKNREQVYENIVHAEANCLLYARGHFENTTLYTTKSPCRNCMLLIGAAQIKKVVYLEPYRDIDSVRVFAESVGISLVKFDTVSSVCVRDLQNLLPLE